ncbi:MAG: glutamine-hydrolyzing GMP synthase [Candidatus Kerfeldbacteria bacterium]|nr:glutamine-hydrolyzing GMP synthase [Candidatus Kerfeldbacteria bacterium]
MAKQKYIAVIDFGSQYSHLITRRLGELGIKTKLLTPQVNKNRLAKAAGLILSGGPQSVIKKPVPYNQQLLRLKLPILGVCYGLQLMARDFGGRVTGGKIREYGPANLKRHDQRNKLLTDWPKQSTVWMSHGDSVTKLPPGFITLGSTDTLRYAAVAHRHKPIFGVQFHPEVHHTPYGSILYQNFAFNICGLKPQKLTSKLKAIEAGIRRQVGEKKVFLLVSGGVDSTVALAVLNRTLGKRRVYGLHIDTGLLREQESRLVKRQLAAAGLTNLHVVGAAGAFWRRLRSITEPETKRQIIGATFLQIKAQVAKKLRLNTKSWLLGQGTIYPDTIESGGTKHADKIKTHHNRINVLAQLAARGLLVEPLKNLYKDEVRLIGAELGLPKELLWAHPFPGPGLAVRALCLDSSRLKQLNQIYVSKITVSKYNTRILPLLSVGVQGDERSYRHPLAIEAPYSKATSLHYQAAKLTNKDKNINRILLKLSGPNLNIGKIKVATLTPQRIKILRQADNIVTQELKQGNMYKNLWQCPTVLVPFGAKLGESIVLRPFASREAMTGRAYLLPQTVVRRIVRRLQALPAIDYIFYDLTDKPPGTVEWE